MQPLRAFIDRVATELGATVSLAHPAASVHDLPEPLRAIYAVTDGLELPFARLDASEQLRASAKEAPFGRAWLHFGFDGYFTHYLVATNPNATPPIAAFDPEVENEPEASYGSVLELLEDEYDCFVENDLHSGDLYVTAIPPSTSLPTVVQELKHVAQMSSAELLKQLRSVPFVLDGVNAATGIAVVRSLHALGVSASLRDIRAEDAG